MTYIDNEVSLGDARIFVDEALVELASPDAPPRHVLICVHGIRDDGAWGADLNIAVQSGFIPTDIRVVSARYDRVSSAGFIAGYRHSKNCSDLREQFNSIRHRFPDSYISVLCHSNGTKVVADIVVQLDFQIEWIFLCGSVCKVSDANKFNSRKRELINEVGTKDWWPVLAEALRPSQFSATGVGGFNRYPVIDRWFPYKHGDGIKKEHVLNWIIPTITTGRVFLVKRIEIGFKKHMPNTIRRSVFIVWVGAIILSIFFHATVLFGIIAVTMILAILLIIFL